MTRVPFTKLVGTGNDFVLVDATRRAVASSPPDWPAVARALCDARTGQGTDGLLVLARSSKADVRMRIFNPDGSEPSMCGNGIRCLAWYAYRRGLAPKRFAIETRAGIKYADVLAPGRVRVDMGIPQVVRCLTWPRLAGHRNVEVDLVDSGVPHLVCWVKGVDRIDVEGLGRMLRRHRRAGRQGANVDFVEVLGARAVRRYQLQMRTYERGVEGETQACGTGAVAAAASLLHTIASRAASRGRASDWQKGLVDVRVPGGVLRVSLCSAFLADEGRLIFGHAFLEGAVRMLSSGVASLNGRSR